MRKKTQKPPFPFLALFGCWFLLAPSSQAGTLSFAKPQRLATLPWAGASKDGHGVPPGGVEWMLVDNQGRFYLESGLDFNLYSPNGKYLQTLDPIDKSENFYGFNDMEVLSDGRVLLLKRLESPQEQWSKDNFEEQTKPGAGLVVLDAGGKVLSEKELVDVGQPHSGYYLENGTVYSTHDDGSFEALESVDSRLPRDPSFGNFSAVSNSLEKWMDHIKKLPVYGSGNKFYHDTKGGVHVIKGALSYLMGRPFVEGSGPVGVRGGKIYYRVVCDRNQDFINAVFVEDPLRKDYGLVELFHAYQNLDIEHGHSLFVDRKGNIYEGVAQKNGYEIYEWKLLN
jgi:hypothetical protein